MQSPRPSVMRAVGSALAPHGGTITVYLARPQSRQLVQDIAITGHIAVVFSEPGSHRTVQVKASSVRIRCAKPGDAPLLARYLSSMEDELQRVGHRLQCFAVAHGAQHFVAQALVMAVLTLAGRGQGGIFLSVMGQS